MSRSFEVERYVRRFCKWKSASCHENDTKVIEAIIYRKQWTLHVSLSKIQSNRFCAFVPLLDVACRFTEEFLREGDLDTRPQGHLEIYENRVTQEDIHCVACDEQIKREDIQMRDFPTIVSRSFETRVRAPFRRTVF